MNTPLVSFLSDKHIIHVVGTRPQFPKVAPVWRALNGHCKQTVIHTGQHYDDQMSKDIIEDVGCHIDITFPRKTSSGAEASREAKKDVLGGWLEMYQPDLVMVYGDCNVSYDAAMVSYDQKIPFAHVEAGLRCGDHRMVEEYNRIQIDAKANILYVPSVDAVYNLACEGRHFKDIQFVGNVMVDSYEWVWGDKPIPKMERFGLLTMHRPENVDDRTFMLKLMTKVGQLQYPIIFPKHPRVNLPYTHSSVQVCEPARYTEFTKLLHQAQFVITDSGGVQEEATMSGTPCLTMRPSTERPVTITEGTNELSTPEMLMGQVLRILNGKWKKGSTPLYWDGKAAERIACHLQKYLS